jgi:uncharacterized protein DUF6516
LIDAHFEAFETEIISDPLVIFTDLYRFYTSRETGYVKGEITFIDGSFLVVFQHVRIEAEELTVTDYRYHYMTAENKLIFRYDNAPHYPQMGTFPHHKHLPSGVQDATMPSSNDLLAEIDSIVIGQITRG